MQSEIEERRQEAEQIRAERQRIQEQKFLNIGSRSSLDLGSFGQPLTGLGGSNPALSGNLILSNHQDTANNLFDKTKDATEKDSNNTNAGAIACGPNND